MNVRWRPLAALMVAALAAALPATARANGLAHAWGFNNRGQLGASGDDRSTAAPVAGVSGTHAAAGFQHSLVVGADGKVHAFGYNYYGQLGDGSTTDRATPAETAPLPAGVSAISVAAGLGHSLALGSDGAVYAWGSSDTGQVGDGSNVARKAPVRVALPAGIRAVAVAAGEIHSLALDDTGAVYAWGDNEYGQMGDGTTTDRYLPVEVSALAGRRIIAIAAGGHHSLAVDDTGKVHAWGANGYGQLGDGAYYNRSTPAQVVGIPSGVVIRGLAAGKYHSLVLGSDGNAYAWGGNDSGELGDGTSGIFAYRSEPKPVTGFPAGVTAVAVAAGSYHSLAIGSDGRAYAWGYNYNGQLGDGATTNRKNPVAVTGLPDGAAVSLLAGGSLHTLALTASPAPPLTAARALRIAGGLESASGADTAAPGQPLGVADAVRLLREGGI